MTRAGLATLMAIAATGCPIESQSTCAPGDDCGPDAVCTDLAECAPASDAPPWRIRWTINGQPIAPGADAGCEAIDELALTVVASDDIRSYRPVTCSIGELGFTALPSRYDQAVLEARADGRRLDRASGERAAITTVDLSF